MSNCVNIQRSLDWCMGTPELPGIKRRVYYISKNQIVKWPTFERDENGRVTSSTLSGSFALVADAKWHFIVVLADKSQLTSEPQGEVPSQTQLNKATLVHPGVGAIASAAAAYLNNSDNVFVVEDMKGNFRILGSERWLTKTTVAQDNGQGTTGTTSTTISVEATDEIPSPFYVGSLETEEGVINCGDGYSGGGNSSGGTDDEEDGNLGD